MASPQLQMAKDAMKAMMESGATTPQELRVVFEKFGIDQALPAFQTTTIEFTPTQPGEYPFRCGMNMLKGLLVVEPPGDRRSASSPHKFHE